MTSTFGPKLVKEGKIKLACGMAASS